MYYILKNYKIQMIKKILEHKFKLLMYLLRCKGIKVHIIILSFYHSYLKKWCGSISPTHSLCYNGSFCFEVIFIVIRTLILNLTIGFLPIITACSSFERVGKHDWVSSLNILSLALKTCSTTTVDIRQVKISLAIMNKIENWIVFYGHHCKMSNSSSSISLNSKTILK